MVNEIYTYSPDKDPAFTVFLKKMKKLSYLLILAVVAGVLTFSAYLFMNRHQPRTPSPTSLVTTNKKQVKAELAPPSKRVPDEAKKTALLVKLKTVLLPNTKYAVSIFDIGSGDSFGINETDHFHPASVLKILIGIVAFEEIENGKHKLSSPLGNYDYGTQIKQMINRSNTDSWLLFDNLFGYTREQQTADRLGLSGLSISPTQMTAKSAQELLLKLYQGEVLTEEHRDLLFSYMQKTNVEDRISVAIPKEVDFYHKEGSLEAGIHDAALVLHPTNPFILVIFTDGGVNPQARLASIQEAAKEVYNYFDSI